MIRFCLILLGPDYKFVRMKSWRPSWGPHGIEWPTFVADRMGMRSSVTPVWNWPQLRAMIYHAVGKRAPP